MKRKQIDLALQGGGAHGAFTWGVLDRLLEDERLEIAGVSGTSAGAMNAVALAAGLMEGGRKGAREALRRFWAAVANTTRFNPLQPGTLGALFGTGNVMQTYFDLASRVVSPYQFNPFNLNPLQDILARTVDFAAVRRCDRPKLFITATQVDTGTLRVFRTAELRLEMVLASACLPMLFQAVIIDGHAYWDGGYTGNPALLPLITESPARDLMLVQINPSRRPGPPKLAGAILDRLNEITFNASLIQELRTIALLKQMIRDEGQPGHDYRVPIFHQVEALCMHRLDASDALSRFGAASKLQVRWPLLSQLHRIGRETADTWLQRNFSHLGRRSTVDLIGEFCS